MSGQRRDLGTLGLRGYASILLALAHGPGTEGIEGSGPATVNELSDRTGISRQNLSRIITRMHTVGLIHVHDWHTQRNSLIRRYAFGPVRLPDAIKPRPKYPPRISANRTDGERRRALKPIASIVGIASVVQALRDGPQTREWLAEETGYNRQTMGRLITMMHAHRLVYVAEWVRPGDSGPWQEGYALWGFDRTDKRKPKPQSSAAIWARCYGKKQARRQMLDISFALAGASHQRAASASV